MLPYFGPGVGIPGVGKRHSEYQRDLEPWAIPLWEHDGLRLGGCRNQVKRAPFDTPCRQAHCLDCLNLTFNCSSLTVSPATPWRCPMIGLRHLSLLATILILCSTRR